MGDYGFLGNMLGAVGGLAQNQGNAQAQANANMQGLFHQLAQASQYQGLGAYANLLGQTKAVIAKERTLFDYLDDLDRPVSHAERMQAYDELGYAG